MQKPLSRPALLLALILSVGALSPAMAQDNNPLINSGALLEKAGSLYDSGAYKQAIHIYQQVDRNDTNYARALYGIALCYEEDSAFDQAIHYSQLGLTSGNDPLREPDLYNVYANSLKASGQMERALRVFDSAIHKYPAYSLLYLNKGTALYTMKRFPEAEAVFKQALMIDPYSYSSHFKLGMVAMEQGKMVPAFLSFIGYLLMTPEGRFQSGCITMLKAIAHNEDNIQEYLSKRKETPSENYQLLEEIIQSKIALDPNYKLLIRLDDPICRQMQVLFEKMQYNESDNDFWNQYYLPFFKDAFNNGQFEKLINHIFSGIDLPAIKEYNQRNKKEILAFKKQAADYFDLIRNSRQLNYKKRNLDSAAWYFSGSRLLGKGKAINNGDKLFGPWEFYYGAGNVNATGDHNDKGEKEGPWIYYYYDGKLKGKELYHDGKQENEETYYFRNGVVSSHSWYKGDKLNGESSTWYREGNPHTLTRYVDGKEEGVKITYYGNGDTSYLENYTAGARNGPVKSWYQGKGTSYTAVYSNGKLEGPYIKYFTNGRVSEEGAYSKDIQDGPWKYYYENGQLKGIFNFVGGKQEGEYKEYYENGKLSFDCLYKKGKLSGEVKYFDEDEKMYSILQYENDQLKSATYFDKTGNQISQSEKKSKTLDLSVFLPDGSKKYTVTFNEKGNMTGPETFFYPSGQIYETDEYNNGELEGSGIVYYPNGKKKIDNNYANGKKDGYHRSWFIDGQLSEEGWYRENEAEGNWLEYNEMGALTDSIYYSGNDLNGYRCEFLPNGRKEYETKYFGGWLEEMTQYDSMGKLLQHFELPGGTGKYRLVYPDGKAYLEVNYIHGYMAGPCVTYYPDGKQMVVKYYKKGALDSVYRDYYHLGGLRQEGHYLVGEKTGVWTYNYRNGKPSRKEEYLEGKLVNKYTEYSEDGKIEIESSYKNNSKEGPTRRYDPDGTLVYQLNYKDDRPVSYTWLDKSGHLVPEIPIVHGTGKIKTFFPNGNVSAEFEYKDGYLTGANKRYYTNGQLQITEMVEYGNTEGMFRSYYSNGKMRHEYNYRHDNLHGYYKEYNDKGILTEEGNYYNGVAHGPVKLYDDSGKLLETYSYYYGKLLSVK